MVTVSRKSLKWLPALAVPALIAAGIVAVPLQAGAAVDLPDKTANEVLQLISDSTEDSFSGTVEKNAELGLPEGLSTGLSDMSESMPDGMDGMTGAGAAGALASGLEFLSGTHEARVFVSGPFNLRVQVKDRLAERKAVSNGTDAWFYDSETNVATHVAIPPEAKAELSEEFDDAAELATPAQIADRILDKLGDSTDFSVGTDSKVAGRTVYELVLTPRTSGTLVESVSISVDSETGLPLQVSVAASGQEEPALEVGFTSIDFSEPAADLFTFAPDDGVIVEEIPLPTEPPSGKEHSGTTHPDLGMKEPVVTGTGWDAVVEVSAPAAVAELFESPLFEEMTTDADGGRVFSTALVTVFFTDDGRVLAGSVALDRLQAVAG
jgi:outer membrane lipoprotein-sorting protein